MSTSGATIHKEDLQPGEAWAVVSYNPDLCAGGVIACSATIKALLEYDINSVTIWPYNGQPAGLYLWHGTIEREPDLTFDGVNERLHPLNMDYWIGHHGEIE